MTGIKKASRNSAAGTRLILDEDRLEVTRKERRQPGAVEMIGVEIKARLVHFPGEVVDRHIIGGEGIVTLIKNRPNLLLVREAKPLKMNMSVVR